MRKLLINLVLLAGVFAAIFLSLELFLRVTHAFGARISFSIPDKVLGWRFVPNREFIHLEENPKPVKFRTNQYGWKDRKWDVQKAPGTFRIAVLGDSYVEGMQVEESQNFVRLAESQLNAEGFKTEWMNFGRSGFTQTEEYLALYQDVLPFKPDLVILFFFPINDIDDISRETASDTTRPFFKINKQNLLELDLSFRDTAAFKIKSFISGIKNHSALISLLSQRYSLLVQSKKVKSVQQERAAAKLQGYLSLATPAPDPQMAKNYELNKRLIREMAELSRKRGVRFLLVSIDTPAYQPEQEAALKLKEPNFDAFYFDKDLAILAKQSAFSFIGLQDVFRKASENGQALHWEYWGHQGREKYWEHGAHSGHWNEAGHEVVAHTLTDLIRSKWLATSGMDQKTASKS